MNTRKDVTLLDVKCALAKPRPGRVAHTRMMPQHSRINTPIHELPTREAGVLILLYCHAQELHFVLTQRTLSVATHKGQISLPGGSREEGETLAETARRETAEELGIHPTRIEILGAPLTPLYIPVSAFWVTAFVGYLNGPSVFTPAPSEVLDVIAVPLVTLLDDSLVEEEEWELHDERVRVPFFNLQGNKVWGATAVMLNEFKMMLQELK